MKKKMIYVVAALMISAVAVFNVITVLEANHVYDLTMTSIDALSENGDGEDQESNDHGSGKIFYETLRGKPDNCILYRNVHISGRIVYTEKEASLGGDWVSSKTEGMRDKCPRDGNGCTAYTCQTTN